MKQSIFQVFKPSLGPSSSHTTGPMNAAEAFTSELSKNGFLSKTTKVLTTLHGSLAATGLGHCTDKAILYGLSGFTAKNISAALIKEIEEEHNQNKSLLLGGQYKIPFDLKENIIFKPSIQLPYHTNSMKLCALSKTGAILEQKTYYSVGGGVVISEDDLKTKQIQNKEEIPYPFDSFNDLYEHGKKHNLKIQEIALANELKFNTKSQVYKNIDQIIKVMEECIEKGSKTQGNLPGSLKVRKRAYVLLDKLEQQVKDKKDPLSVLDWVNLYALAVNEENASGAKIITAPTNGAAGIIPAVFSYYKRHTKNPTQQGNYDFFLTAGIIGLLYMKKASISGAEVGCQGEVGVACSMAAAGLTAALRGSNRQIEKAAEIGMEHNLGLTCDPINGLVQIPCIERNAMASIKAINASRIALMCHNRSFVSLDQVIETMYQTGLDMQNKYKETSRGGLAVNVTNC